MYDVTKAEAAAKATQLPKPVGYHMLVALPEVKAVTDGGVFLPQQHTDREETASVIGFVVKKGDDCYSDKRLFPTGPWCQEGEWVLFRPYTGIRVVVHGKEFRLLKDSEISAVVDNPAGIIRSSRV